MLDAVLSRDDVDAGRVATVGLGAAGSHLVLRALSAEHRLAAAVTVAAPDGADLGATWRDVFPAPLIALLRAGDANAFDREIHLLGLFDPALRTRMLTLARPFVADPDATSAAALLQVVDRFRVDDRRRAAVRTPLLVAGDNPHETFDRLAKRLGS